MRKDYHPTPLTVYKASAGSGKTLTLATEYIKLLIDNPQRYRHILAVTFTNKATEEMKERVLAHLFGIWKGYEDSRVYLNKVTEELHMSEDLARERAGIAMHLLLHDYSFLRVETIDSFFQSILRNLARELELNANLRISIDDLEAEQRAVDEMIENLHRGSEELQWILSYIQDSISDEKSWNVVGKIKSFGENIHKDFYKANSQLLNEMLSRPDFFDDYSRKLREARRTAKESLEEYGKKFFDLLQLNGLSENDLANGSRGIASYFRKLTAAERDNEKYQTTTLRKCLDSPDNWVTKKNAVTGNTAYELVRNTLYGFLQEAEQQRPKLLRQYKSADLTLRHLDQLRLLKSIEETMRNNDREANRFMLSNTQQLLHELIDESDSPFIYEKIGTRLSHIMIDEFQDTSSMQWKNFKVLLHENMSHGPVGSDERQLASNLIVGDVKQSIYRWRGGDWNMLNNLQDEFQKETVDIQPLNTNWRSFPNIVHFNNCFFQSALDIEIQHISNIEPKEVEQLTGAYEKSALVQDVAKENQGKGGFVKIELLPTKNYQAIMLENIREMIVNLMESGAQPKDIAIIARTNGNLQAVADYLSEHLPDVNLVSDETFRLDSSVAVNILVNAMRYLCMPEDKLSLAQLAVNYQRYVVGNSGELSTIVGPGTALTDSLPSKGFVGKEKELRKMPLTDLVEELCRIFELNKIKTESAYLCSFVDQMNKCMTEDTTDLWDFIRAWDETIYKKTIHSNESNGIRLVTIHKSKGLEFSHVIIPFCDWQLEKRYTIWCSPQEAHCNELPIVPVDFTSKQMAGTIYEEDYRHEHLQNVVDNLNLLYVAFTRAKKSLYVVGQKGGNSCRSWLIEECLPLLPDRLKATENEKNIVPSDCVLANSERNKDEKIVFTYGSLPSVASENKKTTHNIFLKKPDKIGVDFESFAGYREFKQSNKSQVYVEEDIDMESAHNYVKLGNVLHDIFSHIHTTDDIDHALAELEQEGVLYDDVVSKEKLINMLHNRLENPRVADWFSPRWTLFNECTILSRDPETHSVVEQRPDRVMTDGHEITVVDFKFGKEKATHHDQVRRYMSLLSDMGYQRVKGYLWYVYSNIIKEVEA